MALYDSIGRGYAAFRRPDARIASVINAALGDADSVVNIGAGAGSYEPPALSTPKRSVLAVEPSDVMIRQRPAAAAPCVLGAAEDLPVATGSFDAAMTVLSAHHWNDVERGLREMVRVARRRVVMLTWVPPPDAPPFWLTEEYFPEILAFDRTIFPRIGVLAAMLERASAGRGLVRIAPVPIPHDCTDGFLCAYWRRPECYLEPDRRSAISSFARIDVAILERGLNRLRADLSSGRWTDRNRDVLALDAVDVGYRVVTCELAG